MGGGRDTTRPREEALLKPVRGDEGAVGLGGDDEAGGHMLRKPRPRQRREVQALAACGGEGGGEGGEGEGEGRHQGCSVLALVSIVQTQPRVIMPSRVSLRQQCTR